MLKGSSPLRETLCAIKKKESLEKVGKVKEMSNKYNWYIHNLGAPATPCLWSKNANHLVCGLFPKSEKVAERRKLNVPAFLSTRLYKWEHSWKGVNQSHRTSSHQQWRLGFLLLVTWKWYDEPLKGFWRWKWLSRIFTGEGGEMKKGQQVPGWCPLRRV